MPLMYSWDPTLRVTRIIKYVFRLTWNLHVRDVLFMPLNLYEGRSTDRIRTYRTYHTSQVYIRDPTIRIARIIRLQSNIGFVWYVSCIKHGIMSYVSNVSQLLSSWTWYETVRVVRTYQISHFGHGSKPCIEGITRYTPQVEDGIISSVSYVSYVSHLLR